MIKKVIPLFILVLGLNAADRPNVVWLVTEDNSAEYLRLYDPEHGAAMPNVERLADNGIVFNNAFSNAPVCSVARSTIITGCYVPGLFANFHRNVKKAPMPEDLEMFPAYLRKAGYYTTNNSKEDYNLIKADNVWDESSGKASYRNRENGQPFFHVQNYGTTHEGHLHFSEQEMKEHPTQDDVETVPVYPIHPDTDLFRYTNAYYRDLHVQVDAEMGKLIQQLEDDGLMDDTIIFYYGDHGGVLPGSKGYIYERGVRVPMVVYIPEKWKHLFPAERGERVNGFVAFVDLGATILNLAGIEAPEAMDGKAFLGEGISKTALEQRDETFSYADRFDEKYDLVRAFRKGKFKYMRNFQPFNFDGLYNFYRYRQLAYKEWKQMNADGDLNDYQAQFFNTKAVECLYDLEADPYELNNLASNPKYSEVLVDLRSRLNQQMVSINDLSLYPEPYLLEVALDNPTAFGTQHAEEIKALLAVANLSLQAFKDVKSEIKANLQSDNEWKRYWAWIVCSSFGEDAKGFMKSAKKAAVEDENNLVRTRAAEFLGLLGSDKANPAIHQCLENAASYAEANLVMNTMAMLRDTLPDFKIDIDDAWIKPEWLGERNSLVKERLEYLRADR